MLETKNLQAKTGSREILKGVNLKVGKGETHVLMGPNGSGKSTLSKVLMGHPHYEVTGGKIILDKTDITDAAPDERSRMGLFMAFQYPTEIPGVNLANFLRLAYNSRFPKEQQLSIFKFRNYLREKLDLLNMPESFMERNLNEGFSGGEKKKTEILQLAVLQPKYAILDETDSGLDVDALKIVFESVSKLQKEYKDMGVLIITHYQRIFDYIKPEFVHVLQQGRIVEEGGMEIVERIEKKGYRN